MTLWRRTWPALTAVAVVTVLALTVWGWRDLRATEATTGGVRSELRSTRTEARGLTADLRDALGGLAALEVELTTRTAERDQLVEEARAVAVQLEAARAALSEAGRQLNERKADATEIRVCLDGISAGLNALAVGDSSAALSRVRAVASSCEAAA